MIVLDFLREWVKSIVLLMFLAGFMEMLIPTGNMQKFIRVVIGLFVIMTILNPILTLMRQEVVWRSLPWSLDAVSTEDVTKIIQQGELVAATGQEQALLHYQRQLEEQVRVIVMSIADISNARAQVLLETDPNAAAHGSIKGIKVWVDSGSREESLPVVKPITVQVETEVAQKEQGDEQKELESIDLQQQVVSVLNTFYNLEPSKIAVYAWEQEV